jgi:hypothetical protein
MTIDKTGFAEQCVRQGLVCGTNPHYLLGVAQLRSKIADDTVGDQIGPFRLTQAEWNLHCTDSAFDLDFLPADITDSDSQVAVFAVMARRAFDAFEAASNRNPTAKELYLQQFAGAPAATLSADLKAALDATAALVDPAAAAVLDDTPTPPLTIQNPDQPPPPPPPDGSVRTSGAPVPNGRDAIAQKIVAAFRAAGLGTFQQAAGLANAIAESALNPTAHASVGEDSWGLFQLNRRGGGLGTGHDPEELKNPDKNIAIVLAEAKKFREFTRAGSLDQAVSAFVRNVERPGDIAGQVAHRLNIASKLLA